MSRTRDIASILGLTEANNESNIRLLKVGDAVQSDGDAVVDINIDGGGNVDKTLAGRVNIGDPVILRSDGLIEKVGQPYTPHQNTWFGIISDSDGSGNTTSPDYGANGWEPQIIYMGHGKFVWVGVTGTTGSGTIYAKMFRLNSDGTAVAEVGPTLTIQSSYYNSGTSYGGVVSNSWTACLGENDRVHIIGTYSYYSSYLRYGLYAWTFYPEDLEDPSNMTLVKGSTLSNIVSATSSTNNDVSSRVMAAYTKQADAEKWRGSGSTLYGGIGINFNFDGGSTYQYFSFRTTGNTVQIVTPVNNTGAFVDSFNYGSRPWLVHYPNGVKHVNIGAHGDNGSYELYVHEYYSSTNGTAGINLEAGVIDNTGTSTNGNFGGCFDSGARHSIIAYADGNNVGQLRTVSHNQSNPIVRSGTTEFAGYINERPRLIHDKGQGKNLILWEEDQETPKKMKMRWFTCDNLGEITLEDSTHIWNGDSGYYSSYAPQFTKFDDYDTAIIGEFRNWSADRYPGNWPNAYENGIWVFKPEKRQQTNLSSTGANYLGIAQDSGDSGDTINIKIHGAIDTNQFGLIPNTTYYLNEINGDLEDNTDNGSIRAGYAVNASSLKILTIDSST